jgi:hypothetical protein
VKFALTITSVLYCITKVCAKMPWGLPGRRFVGTVKTGSMEEESPHAADLTKCTVGDDGTTVRGGNDIPPSNSIVEDDGTTVRGRYGIPPSNTPPSKKHAHHKGGSQMSSLAENGLTNAGCCLADGVDSAAGRMANGHVTASENILNGMGEASMNIRNGMVAVGVCMVVSSSGVCLVAISLLGRSK